MAARSVDLQLEAIIFYPVSKVIVSKLTSKQIYFSVGLLEARIY
jgi:hypothetical protein